MLIRGTEAYPLKLPPRNPIAKSSRLERDQQKNLHYRTFVPARQSQYYLKQAKPFSIEIPIDK